MPRLSPEEMATIPFITNPPQDGRALILLPFYDDRLDDWFTYVVLPTGKLGRLAGGKLHSGIYLSRQPEQPERDVDFFLGTFIVQHVSFDAVARSFLPLKNNLHYFSAALEKLGMFSSKGVEPSSASLLVESELAYLTIIVRRFYDLLQAVCKAASGLVKDVNDTTRRLFRNLPDSFNDVVSFRNRPRTAEEIVKKWALAPPIVDFYAREANHFLLVREIRNAIDHHGHSAGLVVRHARGMAIALDDQPWANLPIWNDQTTQANNLGSVRAIFAYLIADALDLGSRFVNSYWSCIATPQAIAPGFRCFFRDPFSHHLNSLATILKTPWESAQ